MLVPRKEVVVFRLIARRNPVLPPCLGRTPASAARRLAAIRDLLARYEWAKDHEIIEWAAKTQLDIATTIYPPPWAADGIPGSWRRYARDGGGVGGQLALRLASIILDPEVRVSPLDIIAHRALYPAIWDYILYGIDIDAAIRELDFPPPDEENTGVYQLESMQDATLAEAGA